MDVESGEILLSANYQGSTDQPAQLHSKTLPAVEMHGTGSLLKLHLLQKLSDLLWPLLKSFQLPIWWCRTIWVKRNVLKMLCTDKSAAKKVTNYYLFPSF